MCASINLYAVLVLMQFKEQVDRGEIQVSEEAEAAGGEGDGGGGGGGTITPVRQPSSSSSPSSSKTGNKSKKNGKRESPNYRILMKLPSASSVENKAFICPITQVEYLDGLGLPCQSCQYGMLTTLFYSLPAYRMSCATPSSPPMATHMVRHLVSTHFAFRLTRDSLSLPTLTGKAFSYQKFPLIFPLYSFVAHFFSFI